MRITLFYHSLLSDWNHGNAHFLRGVATELVRRGHAVQVYEPADSWSFRNLLAEQGNAPVDGFHATYPLLQSTRYDDSLDIDAVFASTDLVIVHEWNSPALVRQLGERCPADCVLFFHDTHHRAATDPETLGAYDLSHYDGVLAYGNVLREIYLRRGWARPGCAWTWHEAADTSVFKPKPSNGSEPADDLVWIGNWGDDERSAEIEEFLIEPVKTLGLRASVYGVRYPVAALERLAKARIAYRGWLPNYRVPEVFSQFKVTIHVPRRPYVETLRGIPTIRPFEAMACGIPLVCSPWHDDEHLFSPGKDYLVAQDGREMAKHLRAILSDKRVARDLAGHGLQTIHRRHTCEHRVDALLSIYQEVINR